MKSEKEKGCLARQLTCNLLTHLTFELPKSRVPDEIYSGSSLLSKNFELNRAGTLLDRQKSRFFVPSLNLHFFQSSFLMLPNLSNFLTEEGDFLLPTSLA